MNRGLANTACSLQDHALVIPILDEMADQTTESPSKVTQLRVTLPEAASQRGAEHKGCILGGRPSAGQLNGRLE